MSASVARSARALGSTGTTSTASITAPTAGNTLLIEVRIPTASAPVTAFTDNLGNSYTLDHSGGGLYGGFTVYFYRRSNFANAPTSLSITGTSGSFAAIFQVVEVAGLDNTTPLVSTVAKTDLSGGASQSTHVASVTTTNTNDFILIAANAGTGDVLSSASNSFTVVQTPVYDDLLYAAYLADAGAAGAKTTTLTFAAPVPALYFAVVYKAGKPIVTTTGNTVTEGSALRFSLSMASNPSSTTDYSYSWGGTAVNATDYDNDLTNATFSAGLSYTGGNIRFASGTTSGTIDVTTYDNALDQADRTLILTVGGTASTGGTITDDDAPPAVSISDATESFGTVTHTLTLSQASGKTITVQVDSANGSKTAGTHYTAITAQTVTFLPGETEQTVTVTVL